MTRIEADCLRWELTATGAPVLAQHRFLAEGFSAGQGVLRVAGHAASLLGDKAPNQSSDHSAPRQGVQLAVPLPAEATVVNAGQTVVFVRGVAVATLDGQIAMSCEMSPVRSSESVLDPTRPPRLFVGGSAVVLGRAP